MKTYQQLKGSAVFNGVLAFEKIVKRGLATVDHNIAALSLSDLHQSIKNEDVNNFRLAAFKHLNRQTGEHDSLLKTFAGKELSAILGPDILIQTKLNLSIQLPGDTNSQLDLHSDCWAGDSSFQINLWIPLTACFGSNSMFLFSRNKTLKCLRMLSRDPVLPRNELTAEIKDSDFLTLPKGEAVIFNPGLIHGNVVNTTDQTRVSINIRFKNLFSPDAGQDSISRSAGPYYRVFQVSDWTKLAVELDSANRSEYESTKC